MPFLPDEKTPAAFHGNTVAPKPEVEKPSVIGAAFRLENTIGSAISSDAWKANHPANFDVEFDPITMAKDAGHEAYVDRLAMANNKDHYDAIVQDIKREEKDRSRIAESGFFGMATGMVAGLADPTVMIPGVNIVKGIRAGRSAGNLTISSAGANVIAAGVAEGFLQGTQQTRTTEESLLTMGAAAIVGGGIGRGLKKGHSALRTMAETGGGLAAGTLIAEQFMAPTGEDWQNTFIRIGGSAIMGAVMGGAFHKMMQRGTTEARVARAIEDQIDETLGPVLGPERVDFDRHRAEQQLAVDAALLKEIADDPALAKDKAEIEARSQENMARLEEAEQRQAIRDTAYEITESGERPSLVSLMSRMSKKAGMTEKTFADVLNRMVEKKDIVLEDILGRVVEKVPEGKGNDFFYQVGSEYTRHEQKILDAIEKKNREQIARLEARIAEIGQEAEMALSEHNSKRPLGTPRAEWAEKRPEIAKKYLDLKEELGSLKREYRWKKLEFDEKHKKKEKAAKQNEKIAPLKKAMEVYGDAIRKLHKNKELNFKVMPVTDFSTQPSIRLHKSPSYNRKQSSEYRLVLINGDIAYARKSNHWGNFSTNITDPKKAAKKLGITKEDAVEIAKDDPFGRIATEDYRWSLDGGNESHKSSQAGYILLKDIIDDFNQDLVLFQHNASLSPAAKDMTSAIRTIADRILPDDISVDVKKRIKLAGDDLAQDSVTGSYNPLKKLIQIATDDNPDPVQTFGHESIHAFRDLGLLTKREWSTLVDAAERAGWADNPTVRRSMEAYAERGYDEARSKELTLEEAIAEQFGNYLTKNIEPTSELKPIFERIKQFIERLRNAMKGQGFQTADDVFRAINAGAMKDRQIGVSELSELYQAAGTKRPMMPPSDLPLDQIFVRIPGKSWTPTIDQLRTAQSAGIFDGTDMEMAGAATLGWVDSLISPVSFIQSRSMFRMGRSILNELVEVGGFYKENADGEINAKEGARQGRHGSVESRVKSWHGEWYKAYDVHRNAYRAYLERWSREKQGGKWIGVDYVTSGRVGKQEGRMTFAQFNQEVGRSMRRDDMSASVPEVTKAAKAWRKYIFDPLKEQAILANKLPEDVSVDTAMSYFNRVYNKEYIASNPQKFTRIVSAWLGEQQKENADIQVKLDIIYGKLQEDPENPDLWAQIESLVDQWNGKSTNEAQAAIRSRAVRKDGQRSVAADKKIDDAVKKILAADTGKSKQQLTQRAYEIMNRIVGQPGGRLPYDIGTDGGGAGVKSAERGPLAARQFMIPDELIEEFLESDVTVASMQYMQTMSIDTELALRFGSTDMTESIKMMEAEMIRMTELEPENAMAIRKNYDQTVMAIEGMRDRMRGIYALPKNPRGLVHRASREMMKWNYVRLLGQMTLSALVDPANMVMAHGLHRVFGDLVIPSLRNFKALKLSGEELKMMGTALDMELSTTALARADIDNIHGKGSTFEQATDIMANAFGHISLMTLWNSRMKRLSGTLTMTTSLKAMRKMVDGKPLSKRERSVFGRGNISEEMAKRIIDQFDRYGETEGGIYLPRAAKWDDVEAAELFSTFVTGEVDRLIVTPGQEKALFADTPVGKMLLQFKSFGMAMMQRVMIPAMQMRDANVMQGVAAALSLGLVVHFSKMYAAGREDDINYDAEDLIRNAIDRSGLLAWVQEVNNITEKLSAGNLGLSGVGKHVFGGDGAISGRYATRSAISSMLGPSYGALGDVGKVVYGAFDGKEFTARDLHHMRQLAPLQNVFYLRQGLDKLEEAAGEYFDLPGKR